MKKYDPILQSDSHQIRTILELRLTDLFASQKIQKYLIIQKSNPEYLASITICSTKVSSIKLAYHIWMHLDIFDRYSVLNCYRCLFKDYELTASPEIINSIFCAIFINEFAFLLEEALIDLMV